jgi:hypothetical protein
MTTTTLTQSQIDSLHMAGLGMYRPMGDKVIAKCDHLVELGLLGRNPQTGIYFLTEAGAKALTENARYGGT